MAKQSRYRWRDFGGISKSQQRIGTLELQGRPPKKPSRSSKTVADGLPHDIRDYEIRRGDITPTGTLDRRNGRWAWSPTLRLREGDVVIIHPRGVNSS